jgi:hypothetical protein
MWRDIQAQRVAFGDLNDCQTRLNRIPPAALNISRCNGDCINDALSKSKAVVLHGGTYVISATLQLNDAILMGAPGESVVIDASQVTNAVNMADGAVLANLQVLNALHRGVILSGRGNLVHRVSVGRTGWGSPSKDAGSGIHAVSGAVENCLVSTEAFDGFSGADGSPDCPDCQNSSAGFGYFFDAGAHANTLIDAHAYRNSAGGMSFDSAGTAYVYFSSAFDSGKTSGHPISTANGVNLGAGTESQKFYKTNVHDNTRNGFERAVGASQPVFVETNAWGNAGPGGNYAGIMAPGGTTPQPSPDTTASPKWPTPIIGVNIHSGGGTSESNQRLADIMNARRLMSARMDFMPNADVAQFRDQVLRLKAQGIKVETGLQTTYQHDHTCSQNLLFVEQDSYIQTSAMIEKIKDIVQDFELLNEVSLRADTSAEVAPYQGTPASGYVGKPCYATMAAALRGMSRAILDERNTSGLPLKIILGTVSRDFGFLDFMQSQGVAFDILGYHMYPRLDHALLGEDPWYGPVNALSQMAKFNKPVRINEFNCGEIYDIRYENAVGLPNTDACLKSIDKHLKPLLVQSEVQIESIHAYEIVDRIEQPVPENRFGLMYDIDHPKIHLALFSAYSGGEISADEKALLDRLGVASKLAAKMTSPVIGVNIHSGGGNAIDNQKIADIMDSRRLGSARMDFTPNTDLLSFRDQIIKLKAKGIQVETGIQISYQWDHTCNQNFEFVEQDAFVQTSAIVSKIQDLVQDFEFLNDVPLRSDTSAEVIPYQGTPASGYAGQPCYATLASVLKGMSRAVAEQRASSGRPLRAILGSVSRDFGFLDFMQSRGVAFDVVGYSMHPSFEQAPFGEDPWYGLGGGLQQLARFNKPVRIGQFNCAESYLAGYENLLGQARTDACLRSIDRHLSALLAQSTLNLESIHAYEMVDRPTAAPPGDRLGLMYALNMPKLHLALFSAFAGGLVLPSEVLQLQSLGLKSGAQPR